MKKLILFYAFLIMLSSCSSISTNIVKHESKVIPSINGRWAMQPLQNGIANVIEFTKDGKINLYPFNCKDKSSDKVESSLYTIDNERKIRIDSNGKISELNLISINSNEMSLGQSIGADLLTFSYVKVGLISPLCTLYKESKEDKLKVKAFKKEDFSNSPWIPKNPNIGRFLGKWVDEKGDIQIEISADVDGRYRIFPESDSNWNYLYNHILWSGDSLYFRSFSYSDKQELFDHPYHKSSSMMILSPIDDENKIKWFFFVRGEGFEYILSRK